MRKKWMTVLLCGAMTFGLLSGCGGSGDTGMSDVNEAAAPERMPNEPGVTFIPEKFGNMDAELSVPQGARDIAFQL